MRSTILLILMLFLSFHEGIGHAQVYFEETFFPVFVSKNDADNFAGGALDKNVATESGLGYEAHTTLGYVLWNQMLVGLTYNLYDSKTSRGRTANYEGIKTTTQKNEWGPTLGYFAGNWKFLLTYFIDAEKEMSQKYTDVNTGETAIDELRKNTEGTGFQFSVSYGLQLGAGFQIGPTLIYRSVTYAQQSFTVKTGSSTPYPSSKLQTKAMDTDLKPMITLSYRY